MSIDITRKPEPHEIPSGWRIATLEDGEITPGKCIVFGADGKSFVPWDGKMRYQVPLVRVPLSDSEFFANFAPVCDVV